MKKIVLLVSIVLMLALTACKVSPTEEADLSSLEPVNLQTWSYQLVSERCVFDGGSSQVVCQDLVSGDFTYLSNLLNSMSQQGWELDEVVHSSDKSGTIQTFIFRKELVLP